MSGSEEFSECPCTGKTLAKMVQPAVLAVLAQQPLHGYLIVRRLSEMTMFAGECPDPAGVYRVLRSMDQRGLVTSSWDLAEAGPAKRRFKLTPSGRACLERWARTLEQYARSIEDLLAIIREISPSRPGAD